MHEGIKAEILGEISDLLDTGAFTNGPAVEEFEHAFAAYCGTPWCVGLGSGLDALRLGLLAADLEQGDEVVVPAQTFVATLEAVTQAGGVPVVADISESDYGLDPKAAEVAIGPKTRALLPVHLYGQMADCDQLADVADRNRLLLLEDACQAHGAERDGRRAGAVGRAAAFSFYPGKNLGAMGDAGALVTTDAALAENVRALREHGQRAKYVHDSIGFTARLDTVQALFLLRKLAHLDRWNEERRRAAAVYSALLDGVGDLHLPPTAPGSVPSWHLYVVRTKRPEELADFLRARGIGTGRHYPVPVHLSVAYQHLGHRRGDFPVAEALADEGLSLPMFPGITEEQLGTVASGIAEFFRG
ncbi:MAG TPA: DegT/DnrJ/EryC1/StrS family aminotransferase [Gaiellaceae bacterium]